MNAEIIAVGSELLLGQIVNTNARFLSQQLAEMGIDVYYHTVVGDNPTRLTEAISIAEKRSNIIIFTGGLGPTKDDLTKETIARHLNKSLVMDKSALSAIEDYFTRTNRIMSENNKKQAIVLDGAHVIQNDHGMAPGMLLKTNHNVYILLPGPPKEMEPMFLSYGRQMLFNHLENQSFIISRVLRYFGIGEAQLESLIEDIIEQQSNPTVAPLASDGEVTLRLTAKHHDTNMANQLLDDLENRIQARVGQYLYGYNESSLSLETFKLLQQKGLTISCAESLTGGLFQSNLTGIPGASKVFKGGVICYSNEAKIELVNVKPEIIEQYGAVSEACAEELAINVTNQLNSDVGISFTGVAGPEKQEGKPVGTVYIGINIKNKGTFVKKLDLAGSREAIRLRAVKYGFYYLLKYFSSTKEVL